MNIGPTQTMMIPQCMHQDIKCEILTLKNLCKQMPASSVIQNNHTMNMKFCISDMFFTYFECIVWDFTVT